MDVSSGSGVRRAEEPSGATAPPWEGWTVSTSTIRRTVGPVCARGMQSAPPDGTPNSSVRNDRSARFAPATRRRGAAVSEGSGSAALPLCSLALPPRPPDGSQKCRSWGFHTQVPGRKGRAAVSAGVWGEEPRAHGN